jgi:hypothetical protein
MMQINLAKGDVAVRTADGKIHYDKHGDLSPGETLIRLPHPSYIGASGTRHTYPWPTSGSEIVLHAGAPLDDLPIGARLLFTVYAAHDCSLPKDDGRTIGFYNLPSGIPIAFKTANGVTLSGPDQSAPAWKIIILTKKTGAAAWTASGDLAS